MFISLKDLDNNMLPREKALTFGMGSLSDSELVALFIGSGYKGCDSLSLAHEILKTTNGLSGLMSLSLQDIMEIKGIKLAKATQLLASMEIAKRISWQKAVNEDVIKNPELLVNWLKLHIGKLEQEYMVVIFLDTRNHIIGYSDLFKGGVNSVQIHVREIFMQAMKARSAKIIVAHNHPSQDCSPSGNDDRITRDIFNAGIIMGIPLMDHIVISADSYFSYKKEHRI